ncbi:MAG TPA: glycosyltransferase 87 family protein [Solirubrobacteraceae bacterium]|nr:glycosyltransferase 87 family protein [Solirubrobacteraceae bacterium]
MSSVAEPNALVDDTRAHRGTRSWTPALAGVFTLVLLAATLEIVLDGAVGHSPLIPKSPGIASWLSAVGERLGYRVFLIALLCYSGAFLGILLLARRISTRWAIALTAALQLIVFVGPVLISTDVFSYIAYARMGVVHSIDPYLHGPNAISGDPVYRYVGKDWVKVATAYGPLYTLLSYPLAPLGVVGALWGMKLEALLASAGTLALTWRCARMRNLDPKLALIVVGVNPLWVIYGLGGAHNDLIMTLFLMGAVALTLASEMAPTPDLGRARREMYAGAAVLGATLIKATGIALLPFILLRRRRLAPLLGAGLAAVLLALIAYIVFGVHGVDIVSALNRDAAFVGTDSFPVEIAHLFGKPGVFPVDHDLLKAGLVLIVVHLMWRTWRGYDWVAASAWTLLAIAVTSTWLLAWYTLWSLPLAAISRDRRVLYATLAVQGLFIVHQTAPLLAPVS